MVEARVRAAEEQLSTASAAQHAPPTSSRRPRVREVSSRFMSPVSSRFLSPVSSSSSSSSSSSASSSSTGDRDRDLRMSTSDSPFPKHQNQYQQQRSTSVQKHRRRLELEADENRPTEIGRSLDSPFQTLNSQKRNPKAQILRETSRLDTPVPASSSRFRSNNHHRTPSTTTGASTAAAKLLQSSGLSSSFNHRNESQEPNHIHNTDYHRNFCKPCASPLSRSLLTPLTSLEFRKGTEKLCSSVNNFPGLSLPPVVPHAKMAIDTKKVTRKVSTQQEELHSLKLLHNRYLQWRYANSKAETAMAAQKTETERQVYSLGLKISEMNDSVKKKRAELELLQRRKTLSTVIAAQMPYLVEWFSMEEEHSTCLAEASQALINTAVRLPVNGNLKIDTEDIKEALASAWKVMETITSNITCLTPKAEEVETLICDLAMVKIGESDIIVECGDLLSKAYTSQVEECSLRAKLIQSQRVQVKA